MLNLSPVFLWSLMLQTLFFNNKGGIHQVKSSFKPYTFLCKIFSDSNHPSWSTAIYLKNYNSSFQEEGSSLLWYLTELKTDRMQQNTKPKIKTYSIKTLMNAFSLNYHPFINPYVIFHINIVQYFNSLK